MNQNMKLLNEILGNYKVSVEERTNIYTGKETYAVMATRSITMYEINKLAENGFKELEVVGRTNDFVAILEREVSA